MSKQKQLQGECQNRDLNFSISWQKSTGWSVEIYTGYGEKSINVKFYTDGHIKRKKAIRKALKYFKEVKKECTSCQGSGQLVEHYIDCIGQRDCETVDCNKCNGKGVLDE